METYKGTINEFVDWSSGVNSVTGIKVPGVDDEHPISGKSIRELLQDKLKTPFVTYKDDVAGCIRFFSSEASKNLWLTYSDSESLLYDPEKAAEFVLYNMDLPATYKITGLEQFLQARYIIEGNQNSSNANLEYTLGLEDALGEPDSDVITVQYTINDNSNNTTYGESYQLETGSYISKNIYQYLRSGENKVTIKATANNHNASTTRTFSVYLVKFSISSNFAGYYTGVANGVPFSFDVAIQRSITNLPVTTKVYVDEVDIFEQSPVVSWRYTDTGSNPSKTLQIPNIYAASDYENNRKHTLSIYATMEDEESHTSFKSNVLIYEFEVASNLGDLVNSFVNSSFSTSGGNYTYDNNTNKVILKATQYVPFQMDWGYYTDNGLQQSDVSWSLRTGLSGAYEYTELVKVLGVKGVKPSVVSFIPNQALSYDNDHSYLIAKINNDIVAEFPIDIAENNINISETGNYSLKLSAYGKTNFSDSKDEWIDYENSITTTFSSGVTFDNTNGWDNNSLVLRGVDCYATINYNPFPETYNDQQYNILDNGAAFEIDFQPEQVNNDNDVLLTIGDTTKAYIAITPNSAAYYESGSPLIKTNFKTGERIKLVFIFNRYSEISTDSNLIYIVNNGILERAAAKGNASINSASGNIKIGGSASGIRVYSIRAYRQNISPKQALDNYIFDNISDSALVSRNDVYGNSSTITYAGVQGKQDIIIIEGDLTNILKNKDSKENATVKITRESNLDGSKNFTVTNCRIRNHGQSTLSYPITSMKIWLNKSNVFYEDNNGVRQEYVPEFVCSSQTYIGLNKNRYIMKNGAIPSNKFVLQANYADSSGAHNGSLLRLINDTWYNAQIDGEFKLRTAPQLFTSGAKITHNNQNLNEDNSWIEGYYNIDSTSSGYMAARTGLTWPEITNNAFPYNIRNAADSFPCVVFYRDTSSNEQSLKLLGQYVFMDDKKSDFVYGERSIYYHDDISDPFCLKTENKKKDKAANKVWDNKNVLQIEVVYPNSPLTSYSSKVIASNYELDENDNLIPSGETHRFNDALEVDQNGKTTSYYWEQHFELIYPDKEDIVDNNDNFSPDKFTETVTPFMNFMEWITDVAALKNTGQPIGAEGSEARVTQAELNKFMSEAHDHLDLYKLAAYYIFFLRFGLVDSVERNAQLKTYDGQHWHYEPWDMDIALGCANNGVIAYEPPLTRDTRAGGTTYAYSGRTTTQSNVLWDCLECWDYWANTLVPEVATALYDAGLTYDNVSKMFDEEYVEKWSETLYNESGHYKYIEATNTPKYRAYLNGARTSHRHWWLSKSMNYYDAKWSCGDFSKHSISFRISKPSDVNNYNLIKIYPTNNTYFKAQYGTKGSDTIETLGNGLTSASVTPGGEAVIDAYIQLEDKQPCFIYGATSIEGIDMSGLLNNSTNTIGRGYTDIKFADAYDNVLGAQIKRVKLGAPCTPNIYEYPNENTYVSNLSIGQNGIEATTTDGNDALANLELLDVNGWYSKTSPSTTFLSEIFSGSSWDRKNITTFYAMGCDHANEFKTANAGNKFADLRLPTSVRTIEMINSSWENFTFWNSTAISNTRASYTKVQGVPASVNNVKFKGTTGRNECSAKFVKDWIDSIEAKIINDNPGYTTEEVEAALWTELGTKTFQAEQINWGAGNTKFYYKDLIRLSKFGKDGMLYNIRGYIIISDLTELTSAQLTELQNIFGPNVFNIGTTTSNLVVDQNLGYVRIGVSGATVDQTTGHIQIAEPNSANLTATSFTLSGNQFENYVFGAQHNLSNLTEGQYLWAVMDNNNASSSYKSLRLVKRANGLIQIQSSEGDFGNYSADVIVYYKSGNTVSNDTLSIDVIGVTYPTDFIFGYDGQNPRQFLYTTSIARTVFGQSYSLQATLPTTYILSGINQVTEFFIVPQGQYTATINQILYNITDLDVPSDTTGFIDSEELGSSDSTINYMNNLNLGYTKDAQNGGINVKVIGNPPSTMKKYKLQARIFVGGRSAIDKIITLIVYDDDQVIVDVNLSDPLYSTLQSQYKSNYSLTTWDNPIHKTELMSLYGTLDFSNQTSLPSLMGNDGYSILLHTNNITSLILDGCSAIATIDNVSQHNNFDFSNIPVIETLSLNGCTGLNGQLLDLSTCPTLVSLDVRNTSAGVSLPSGTVIEDLKLGSPYYISIINPTVLGESGTTYSIQSSQNITTLILQGINGSNPRTFTVFGTTYND